MSILYKVCKLKNMIIKAFKECFKDEELCDNAREKVLKEFDSKVVAKKYIELYEEVLSDTTKK